ncbi:UNVERIFIED_CONTAM: hypothetical protein Sindi_2562100 [Sesamum indicum]
MQPSILISEEQKTTTWRSRKVVRAVTDAAEDEQIRTVAECDGGRQSTADIQNDELDGILARTEFARGEMPVRYLGIPLAAQRLSVTNYSPLVDQIVNCISKWTGKSLSYAGRLELIRSNSRRAPVTWEEICHPKEEGGLGIRHIQSWNVALLARVLWNIHRKADTLWVQWVNGVYLRGASIWDWQPKKGDSLLLQQLAEIRNRVITDFGSPKAAIEQMTRWSTQKGLQTSIAYEYFRPKLARQPWKAAIWKAFIPPKYSFILWLGLRGRLATRDKLGFLQRRICAHYASTPRNRPSTFSLSARSATSFGHASDTGLALTRLCQPFKVLSSGSRRRKQVPPCRTKHDTSLWHARFTHFGGIGTKSSLRAQRPVPMGLLV